MRDDEVDVRHGEFRAGERFGGDRGQFADVAVVELLEQIVRKPQSLGEHTARCGHIGAHAVHPAVEADQASTGPFAHERHPAGHPDGRGEELLAGHDQGARPRVALVPQELSGDIDRGETAGAVLLGEGEGVGMGESEPVREHLCRVELRRGDLRDGMREEQIPDVVAFLGQDLRSRGDDEVEDVARRVLAQPFHAEHPAEHAGGVAVEAEHSGDVLDADLPAGHEGAHTLEGGNPS